MAATSAAETVPDPTPSPLPAAVDTIIIGAGVVGCCLAQRLARPGLRLLVVDGASAACAASGRSGGFLASDWSDGPLGELSALSFSLHNQLAAEFDGARRWGYRRLTTVSAPFAARGSKAPDSIPWLDGAAAGKVSTMGTPDTTAQITPRLFTLAMLAEAQKQGAVYAQAEATGLVLSDDGARVTGVKFGGQTVSAKQVALCMGPWTHRARAWLPSSRAAGLPAITGSKAHSIVLQPAPDDAISAHAIFIDYRHKGKMDHPEIYPRPDGTVYVCGSSDKDPLPDDPLRVAPTPGACESVREIAGLMSSALRRAEWTGSNACYLPISPDGEVVMGAVPRVEGLFVASGHSCWGMLNAPATGLLMSELMTTGKTTKMDISAFSPDRCL